jgi:hypothetical protein
MQKNLSYFEYCKKKPEDTFEKSFLFLEKDPHLEEYVSNTKEIKTHLFALKLLLEKKESAEVLDKYFRSLQNCLGKYSNCSEFVCFAHACDTTLEHLKKDFLSLKKVTCLFLKKRDLTELTPEEWIQALIDSHSSRRKGNSGEKKLKQICQKFGFIEAKNWDTFENENRVFASFSKKAENPFGLKTVREKLKINLRMNDPTKAPDLLIKKGKKILIVEAKHLNVSGGGQNKQIQELIDFISIEENQKNVYYIAFMDGVYSNKILGQSPALQTSKIRSQHEAILENLKRHPTNFWLNTAGFIRFLQNL